MGNRSKYWIILPIAGLITLGLALFMSDLTDSDIMFAKPQFNSQKVLPPPRENADNQPLHRVRNEDLPIKYPKRPYNHLTDRDPHHFYPEELDFVANGKRPTKPEIKLSPDEIYDDPFKISAHESAPGQLISHGRVIARIPEMATKSGSCRVRPWVNEQGKVVRLNLLECSENIFEAETRKAVMKWRYHPLLQNGTPISFEAEEFKVRYRLLDEGGNIIPE